MWVLCFRKKCTQRDRLARNTNKLIKYVHFFFQGDNCPKPKNEANDLFLPTSCLDYLSRGASICGMYELYDNAGNSYPAYCDLKSEPGTAWTWWCLGLTCIIRCHLSALFPLAATLQWTRTHKIGIYTAWVWHEWDHCKLIPLTGVQLAATQPMVWISETTSEANFKDFNVVDFSGSGKCMKVEYVNIRGHMRMHLTARVWQSTSYFWHIDSSNSGRQFDLRSGSVWSEDNFGFYLYINPKFRCNEGPHSNPVVVLSPGGYSIYTWVGRCGAGPSYPDPV